MNLILFEDEPIALEHTTNLVKKVRPDINIIATADSVEKGQALLSNGLEYDLLLCDIKLADGNSFEILNFQSINKPIIFLTAYDQYALQSYQHLCIDYILKPVSEEKIRNAFNKFDKLISSNDQNQLEAGVLEQLTQFVKKDSFKKRFISKVGNKIVFKEIDDIAYFYSEDKVVYLKEKNSHKRYIINHSLEELESKLLNPAKFYRINRSIIINLEALIEMKSYHNGRLKLSVSSSEDLDLIVAREKVSEFKSWINQ